MSLPVPPPEMNFVGDGDFDAIGREFLRYFGELGGLQPFHRVLDVGCGIGRMARPLTEYLDARGSYDGFDIVEAGVDWCQRNITPHYRNFRFRKVDVYNPSYNASGRLQASDYIFPYRSRSFEFVFLTSVFTHMLPAAVENYVREINRVLKIGGRCFATFFLQNAETRQLGEAGRGAFIFRYRRDGYWIADPAGPDENAVAYDEDYVLDLYRRCGLAIDGHIHWGNWCGRAEYVSAQDIVVARKAREVSGRWSPRRIARSIRQWTKRIDIR